MTDDNWHAKAACRKPWVDRSWFFPQDQEDLQDGSRKQAYGDDGLRARLICAACPVFAQCWQENRDARVGIFAGTDERERTRMLEAARTRMKRREGSGAGIAWSAVPVPDFRPLHVASPALPVQIGLYAFLHGQTVAEATDVAEIPEGVLRRAIDEHRRVA